MKTNIIYCGDNRDIMANMPADSVDLIYLDPPFFTQRDFENERSGKLMKFTDKWEGGIGEYLDEMAIRIILMHRILKKTGSIYFHCDQNASHYLKVILDEIFGKNNFKNEIIWYYGGPSPIKTAFARKHDVILLYSKSISNSTFNPQYGKLPQYLIDRSKKDEAGRSWVDQNLGKISKKKIEVLKKEGKVFKTKTGNLRRKQYLDEMPGSQINDVWSIPIINSQAKEKLGYPTQKPVKLLEKIIKASSDKGDIIFDPFCGCGTSTTVAEAFDRKWIGCDLSNTAVEVMEERLTDKFIHTVDALNKDSNEEEVKNKNLEREQDFCIDYSFNKKPKNETYKNLQSIFEKKVILAKYQKVIQIIQSIDPKYESKFAKQFGFEVEKTPIKIIEKTKIEKVLSKESKGVFLEFIKIPKLKEFKKIIESNKVKSGNHNLLYVVTEDGTKMEVLGEKMKKEMQKKLPTDIKDLNSFFFFFSYLPEKDKKEIRKDKNLASYFTDERVFVFQINEKEKISHYYVRDDESIKYQVQTEFIDALKRRAEKKTGKSIEIKEIKRITVPQSFKKAFGEKLGKYAGHITAGAIGMLILSVSSFAFGINYDAKDMKASFFNIIKKEIGIEEPLHSTSPEKIFIDNTKIYEQTNSKNQTLRLVPQNSFFENGKIILQVEIIPTSNLYSFPDRKNISLNDIKVSNIAELETNKFEINFETNINNNEEYNLKFGEFEINNITFLATP